MKLDVHWGKEIDVYKKSQMKPKALECSGKNILKNHKRNPKTRTHNFKQEPLGCFSWKKLKKKSSSKSSWASLPTTAQWKKKWRWDTLKCSTLILFIIFKIAILLTEGKKNNLREQKLIELSIINISGKFVLIVKMGERRNYLVACEGNRTLKAFAVWIWIFSCVLLLGSSGCGKVVLEGCRTLRKHKLTPIGA